MKILKALSALAAAAAVGLLAACGPATDRGEIIQKRHTDSYTYYQHQCYTYDSKGQCAYSQLVPVTVPEDFDVRVRDDAGTEAWLDVSAGEYASLKTGDWYGPEAG